MYHGPEFVAANERCCFGQNPTDKAFREASLITAFPQRQVAVESQGSEA
ncbi:MAG: hypothetical protein HKN62_17445 [Phycisphaerales bacterium]|nr:hypothetical protein [Phycisphaerales bacterium]